MHFNFGRQAAKRDRTDSRDKWTVQLKSVSAAIHTPRFRLGRAFSRGSVGSYGAQCPITYYRRRGAFDLIFLDWDEFRLGCPLNGTRRLAALAKVYLGRVLDAQ